MNKKAQIKRAKRTRASITSTNHLLRLSIHRSNVYMSAQVIDDGKGVTVIGVNEKSLAAKGTKTERAKALGMDIAKKALAKKVTSVVFDRGGYRYHGRVKAFADGAREGGLKF